MLEFKPDQWTGFLLQGNAVHAVPVSRTAEEAAGAVILTLRELIGDKMKLDIRNNADGQMVILAASTANGYPVPEEVEAFVLPTTSMEG